MDKYQRTKKWREENPDKHREQWLRWYQKHKDKILKNKREKYRLKKIINEELKDTLQTTV